MLVDEMLSKEYGWLPYQTDKIEVVKIIKYIEIASKRNEIARKSKIQDYIMYLLITYADNPNNLLRDLNR